ncbi:YtxH domain-containing protein [Jeotgalibacillus proteolyticus]|uniref:YtxH domain-containing protein n=1 Tax=Jeotgalibacillus proteolyticus TaxID=2082395 RepID=A0A2S5G7E0_9BACL|nr:YtxH domain-containing protein [Jeotgalibacillus proteolyticus]PPA68854.1 hypothetical protein C4B60_18220 [Jeotgalibacillus proteolyticus]
MAGNKLSAGILWGALIGGALALLDKETRTTTFEAAKKSRQYISYYSGHPRELTERAKNRIEKLKLTVEQIQDDYEFLTSKLEEVKEMTPQLKNILTETKETFESSGEAYKHALSDDTSIGNEENRSDLFLERNRPDGNQMM